METSTDSTSSGPLARIVREVGGPGVVDALAERLSPTDLQTLLLTVHRRRAARLTPAALLAAYTRNRFTAPAAADAAALARLTADLLDLLRDRGHAPVALAPVTPLGTVSALSPLDQNRVLTTDRTTEVQADATNALALECAVRRRDLLAARPRSAETVSLAAVHRVVRAQAYGGAARTAHFSLLGLCTAGRDTGSFRFESAALAEHLAAHLAAIRAATGRTDGLRVTVTDLSGGARRPALAAVLDALAPAHPGTGFAFDDARAKGRGYYRDACFSVDTADGANLSDGGFTDWTAALLANAKERLLTSGFGLDGLLAAGPAVSPAARPPETR